MSFWSRLFKRKSDDQPSVEEFVKSAMEGRPAGCQIRITEYPQFREVLHRGLADQGLSASRIVSVMNDKLSASCPKCGARMTGEYLGWLEVAGAFGAVMGGGAHRVARFKQGRCANERCSSGQIVLMWKGP